MENLIATSFNTIFKFISVMTDDLTESYNNFVIAIRTSSNKLNFFVDFQAVLLLPFTHFKGYMQMLLVLLQVSV